MNLIAVLFCISLPEEVKTGKWKQHSCLTRSLISPILYMSISTLGAFKKLLVTLWCVWCDYDKPPGQHCHIILAWGCVLTGACLHVAVFMYLCVHELCVCELSDLNSYHRTKRLAIASWAAAFFFPLRSASLQDADVVRSTLLLLFSCCCV